jgi:hypothetical protein
MAFTNVIRGAHYVELFAFETQAERDAAEKLITESKEPISHARGITLHEAIERATRTMVEESAR